MPLARARHNEWQRFVEEKCFCKKSGFWVKRNGLGRQARPSRAGEHEPRQGRRWGFRSDSWLCCGLGTRACASTGAGGGGLERQRAVLTGCENTGVVAVQDGACACGRVCGAGRRSGGLCLGTGQLERRRRSPRRAASSASAATAATRPDNGSGFYLNQNTAVLYEGKGGRARQ